MLTMHGHKNLKHIDLTVVNNRLLKNFHEKEIGEDESCSNCNIIKFKLGHETNHVTQHNKYGLRYIIHEMNYNRFDQNLEVHVAMKFQMENTED